MNTRRKNFALALFLATTSTGFSQQTTFTKVATGPIVTDMGLFIGAAWGDFNNNGLLDLLVCNWKNRTNVFYRNNGNGTFIKLTDSALVQDADNHVGAAVGDFDNDGNLDLAVAAGDSAATSRRTLLYRNDGDGTFSQVSGGSLTNQLGYFGPCLFADFDNDGFLDLFITDHGHSAVGGNNLLFRNNGDGTFNRIMSGPLTNDFAISLSALWADYDNDGFMDLICINISNSQNFLYHNNGNGTFSRIHTNAIATDSWPSGAEGGAWGDYDNDGLLDLFVTDNGGLRNRLYHNNGNGAFTNVNSGPMLRPPGGGASVGCAWGDYDNDGYLDLFVGNFGGNNALFHNMGDGTFTQVNSVAPVQHSGGATCGWVDYDNDGFLDLFVTPGEAPGQGLLPNLLYHNNGNSNAWLEVKCVGTVVNRSAIGTKVRVQATIGGKTFWQMREINQGGGWNLQPLVAHFGLGEATNVNVVRIEWPSGTIQELQNVASRKILTVTEPPRLRATMTNGVPFFQLKAWPGMRFGIESSIDLAAWASLADVTVANANGLAQIAVTNQMSSVPRFYRAVSR